jgi:hypothetical protein
MSSSAGKPKAAEAVPECEVPTSHKATADLSVCSGCNGNHHVSLCSRTIPLSTATALTPIGFPGINPMFQSFLDMGFRGLMNEPCMPGMKHNSQMKRWRGAFTNAMKLHVGKYQPLTIHVGNSQNHLKNGDAIIFTRTTKFVNTYYGNQVFAPGSIIYGDVSKVLQSQPEDVKHKKPNHKRKNQKSNDVPKEERSVNVRLVLEILSSKLTPYKKDSRCLLFVTFRLVVDDGPSLASIP